MSRPRTNNHACACGCGKSLTKPNAKYLLGHSPHGHYGHQPQKVVVQQGPKPERCAKCQGQSFDGEVFVDQIVVRAWRCVNCGKRAY